MKTFKNVREGWTNYMRYLMSKHTLSPKLIEMGERRSQECIKCPELQVLTKFGGLPATGNCRACRCFFPPFVYAPEKNCPKGKWVSEEFEE